MSFLDEEKYSATTLKRLVALTETGNRAWKIKPLAPRVANSGRPGERQAYVLALKPCTLPLRITDCTASEWRSDSCKK